MKKYKVVNVTGWFGLFEDEEYEGEDKIEVMDQVMCEIEDNIGNYIDIELEEIFDDVENDESDDNEN